MSEPDAPEADEIEETTSFIDPAEVSDRKMRRALQLIRLATTKAGEFDRELDGPERSALDRAFRAACSFLATEFKV